MNNQKSHKNVLVCPYCINVVDDIKSHINASFDNGKTFSCNDCDLVIPNKQCVSSHMQIVHTDPIRAFCCETCIIDFISRKYLFIHKNLDDHKQKETESRNEFEMQKPDIENNQNEVSQENEVEIEEAEEEMLNLNKEVQKLENNKNQTNLKDTRLFKCEKCPKTFKRRDHLRSHDVHIHQITRNHQCDMCQKSFKTKRALRSHDIGIHSDIKKYKCDQCTSEFKFSYSLKTHKQGWVETGFSRDKTIRDRDKILKFETRKIETIILLARQDKNFK